MALNGSQFQLVQSTLLAAFDETSLRQLVKFQLNEDLDQVGGGKDLVERSYNLVAWADKRERVHELISSAVRQNPNNPDLQTLVDAERTWHIETPALAEVAPYKGLEVYDVADAPAFFGREVLVSELVTYLKDHRFLAIVGASGSGKSSVMRAGIVASLQRNAIHGSNKWIIRVVKPTAYPLKALAASLTQDSESMTTQATLMDDMSKDTRSLDLFASRLVAKTGAPQLLLVIDQFEELFTLCADLVERKSFVDNLLVASANGCATSVIIALRADFYADCAQFEDLRLALQEHQKYIGPMAGDELRAAIEMPAERGSCYP